MNKYWFLCIICSFIVFYLTGSIYPPHYGCQWRTCKRCEAASVRRGEHGGGRWGIYYGMTISIVFLVWTIFSGAFSHLRLLKLAWKVYLWWEYLSLDFLNQLISRVFETNNYFILIWFECVCCSVRLVVIHFLFLKGPVYVPHAGCKWGTCGCGAAAPIRRGEQRGGRWCKINY